MKRFISVFLSLILMLSLCFAFGSSALAEEDDARLTIVVTGGVGSAIGGEGLSYASAAALRDRYEEGKVMLVDAGGFDIAAAPVISAAGYDLVVPDEIIAEWDVTSVSTGIEDLNPGVFIKSDELNIAFIGVSKSDELSGEELASTIQENIDLARESADYIVIIGDLNAEEVAKAVTGADLILTYGSKASPALPEEESEEGEDAEEPETDGEAEGPVIGIVEKGFGTIGLAIFDENGISFKNVDKEAYDELELTESEEITALEDAFAPTEDGGEETEQPESGEETEQPEEGEEPESGEETEQPENMDGEEPEETPEATPEATPATTTINWQKGNLDLVVDLTEPVVGVKVNGGTLDSQYYTSSNDGKTVSIHADVLNGWGNGFYSFEFDFATGGTTRIVNIAGEAPVVTPVPAPPVQTTSPAGSEATPTAAPTATPAQTAAPGSRTPATGDTNPVGLYVVILVVLVAALAVVVVLVIRKKKNTAE